MLYGSLLISATFLAVVIVLAALRGRKGIGLGVGLSTLFLMGGCLLTSAAELLTGLLVMLVGLICWILDVRPRSFAVASVVALVVAYAIVGAYFGVPEVHRWNELQAQYPLESLDERLAYETRPHSISFADKAALDSVWLESLEGDIAKRRNEFGVKQRLRSLERLHAGAVKQFVESEGFGVGRMISRPRPSTLARPYVSFSSMEEWSLEPIPQPLSDSWRLEPNDGERRNGDDEERMAHRANSLKFLDPAYFGYARDRQHVAGFRTHAFNKQPQSASDWTLNRLDLVGILKFDEPVVYLTPNFPRMEEVQASPTRSLDAFETESLAALLRGEDLVARESAKQLRLFGSLRATKQCQACHHGERGDLLGAFTYQFSR
jgi:hypothetical protein